MALVLSEKPVGTTGSSGEPVASRDAARPTAVHNEMSVTAEGLVTTFSSPCPLPVAPALEIVRTDGIKALLDIY